MATGYYEIADNKHYTLAERWNGSTWTVQKTPSKGNSANLVSVSCGSSSECVAVGWYVESAKTMPLVEIWNGESWKVKASATLPSESKEGWFEGVSCAAAKACTAVGTYQPPLLGEHALAESWKGSGWSVQATAEPESHLLGVSCTAASACTAVGDYKNADVSGESHDTETFAEEGLIERWNGTSWQLQTPRNPEGRSKDEGSAHWAFSRVSCASASACVAVGYHTSSEKPYGTLLGEYWTGTSWELESPVDRPGVEWDSLEGLSCPSEVLCMAVGYSYRSSLEVETLAEKGEEF